MKAVDCIDGQLYDLPSTKYHQAYFSAECHGLDRSIGLVLFLIFDEHKGRVIIKLLPEAEVFKVH